MSFTDPLFVLTENTLKKSYTKRGMKAKSQGGKCFGFGQHSLKDTGFFPLGQVLGEIVNYSWSYVELGAPTASSWTDISWRSTPADSNTWSL